MLKHWSHAEVAAGGGALMGRWVRRRQDGAVGQVRQQRVKSVMVWVPARRINLTFREGTYDVLKEAPYI